MTEFSKPLMALSLTEPDQGLLQYAAMLAAMMGWSEVRFAHVVPPDRADGWDPHPWVEKMEAEVERLFSPAAPNCRSLFHAAKGSRVDQLVGLAAENQCDLIVLGHRRNRSGKRSLARRLAMTAPTSILLVPEGSPVGIRSILVPTDFSDHSADALRVAVGISRAAGLERLQIVHVYFDPSTVRFDEHLDEILGEEEEEIEKLLAGIDTQGIEVEALYHESTQPSEAILRTADRCGSDLIVMNTRGRSRAAYVLLGSTTSDTIAATTVPILVIKHYGSRMSLLEALVNHRLWEEKSPKTN